MISRKFIIEGDTITRQVGTDSDERNLINYVQTLGTTCAFETGILPPGVRSYRQAGDHSQFVLEIQPGVNKIIWGAHEGSGGKNAPRLELAQPWQYGVADFVKGNFLGCRLFYSWRQITSENDPLYMANVPNTNYRGYGQNNGIGWICFYLNNAQSNLSLGQKALYVMHRISGQEAFNDSNMSGTDGTRYYQSLKKPGYTWDKTLWDKKSEKEGLDWVFDPDLWIPVKVTSQDDQKCMNPKGVPLTLAMAMYGNTGAYYSDTYQPKPINALHRKLDTSGVADKIFDAAFVATPKSVAATPPASAETGTSKVSKKVAGTVKKAIKGTA